MPRQLAAGIVWRTFLLLEVEFLDETFVRLLILSLEVFEMLSSVGDHLKESSS